MADWQIAVDHVITDPPYESVAMLERHRFAGALGDGNRALAVEPLGFEPITVDDRASSGEHFARLSRRWTLVFGEVDAAMKWKEAIPAGTLSTRGANACG